MPKFYRARLFPNGGSQAVRLPKECRFEGSEVLVRREGERVILEPVERTWSAEFLLAFSRPRPTGFPDREQPSQPDTREDLDV